MKLSFFKFLELQATRSGRKTYPKHSVQRHEHARTHSNFLKTIVLWAEIKLA